MLSRAADVPAVAREADAFGKTFFLQLAADRVKARVGDIGQPVDHTQREQHGRVNAERDARISALDPAQALAGGRGSLSQDSHGNAPPQPGVSDVLAQLAQGTCNRNWRFHNESYSSH